MASDINEQVSNAYQAAKQALNDDLSQNLYDAVKARNYAYRQMNNKANANHSLYSGAPAGLQMQYDKSTYLPGVASAATAAMNKMQTNQANWDSYQDYIKQMNDQINKLNAEAAKLRNATGSIPTTSSAGSTATRSLPVKETVAEVSPVIGSNQKYLTREGALSNFSSLS